MTRTRNGSFQGTQVFDADIDAPDFTRVLLEVAQDLNMVYDRVTGENTPAAAPVVQTMVHSGASLAGSLLGVPVANQAINVRIGMADTDLATYGGDTYIIAVPFFVSAGETLYTIEVDSPGEQQMTLEVYDQAGAQVLSTAMSYDGDRETHLAFAQFAFAATSTLYYVMIRMVVDGSYVSILGWRAFPSRSGALRSDYVDQHGSSMPVPVAGAGVPIAFETVHDEMIVDNYATAGWLLTTLNRNLNALQEAMTGAPVHGNAVLSNSDSGDPAPATSRFLCHGRNGLTNEPLVDWPIWCEALGACRTDGKWVVPNATPPITGLSTWYAPFARVVAASVGHRARLTLPDFNIGGFYALSAAAIFVNDSAKGTPTNWSVRINTFTAGATGFTAVTQLGTSPFYVAVVSGVPYTPDTEDTYSLEMQSAGAFTFGELALLGWALYFDQ